MLVDDVATSADAEAVSGSGEEPTEEADDEPAADDPLEAFRRELWAKPGDWFVVHTYSGMENRVKSNLENRIISLNMEDYIHEIVVPTEEVAEIKNGQRKMVSAPSCPGTSWSAWTSPTSPGPPCGTRPRSPASSATATSRCR